MIQLNDYTFSTCIVQQILHDSGTPQELNAMKLARRDGAKLISSNYGPKTITIVGIIKGDTQAELEQNIDEFKQKVSVINGNLDIDYAGGSRRYAVNCTDTLAITRDHYHITYAPFEVKFVVLDPPFGQGLSAGQLLMNEAFSANSETGDTIEDSFTADGTATPKPKIRFFFDNVGDINEFDFINLSTSKQINISTAFTSGDDITIDNDNLSVLKNGEPLAFEGIFPEFKVGSNSFQSNFYSDSGVTLSASQDTNNSKKPFYGGIKLAQSFQCDVGFIPSIKLLLNKVGVVTSDVTIRIETDSAGTPSGTVVANGEATLSSTSIIVTPFWNTIEFTSLELSASTTYWIVVYTTGGDADNRYEWRINQNGGYALGTGARYYGSWTTYSHDFCFKVYVSSAGTSNTSETQESISEGFSTDTNKDAGNTTADWNTSLGRLRLNISSDYTIDSFSESNYNADAILSGEFLEIAGAGQSFSVSSSVYLKSVKFYLKKANSPSGNMTVKLQNHVGTYGSTGFCNSVLNTAGTIDASTLTTSYQLIEFTFATPTLLTAGQKYIVTIEYNNTGFPNVVYVGRKSTGTSHSGNAVYIANSEGAGWGPNEDQDVCFYALGGWDITNNVGQSNALDSYSSVIASATINASDSIPASTSITYQISSDGTNFENVTNLVENYFTNIGSALKFKATLTGTTSATPYVDTLAISYKLAGILSNTDHRIAQSFVSSFSGTMGSLQLNVKKFGNPTSITAKIYSDSGAEPDTELATSTYLGTVQSSQFGWITINFNSPATLSASTTYWIVISGAGVDASNGYLIRSRPGNTYADGTFKYSTNAGTDYSEYANEDILFKTYPGSSSPHEVDLKITYNPRYL